MREEDPDILCLQETKCAEKALPAEITSMPEYPHKYWAASGDKEGYSGVAMLCKTEPIKVTYGIGKGELCVLLSYLWCLQMAKNMYSNILKMCNLLCLK